MSSRRLRGGAPKARSGGGQPPGQTRLPAPQVPAPAKPAFPPSAGGVVGSDALRLLPPIEPVAAALRAAGAQAPLATALAREAVDALRAAITAGRAAPADRAAAQEAAAALGRTALDRLRAPGIRPVINATGTVLHTGLGRAPLSASARARVQDVLEGWCELEVDPATGERADRQAHVAPLLARLYGAEAALVVNNCAGAAVLCLMALAQGREVIVSRGELVEIGGSFRVPEILAAAGCRLVEVGATNKTHAADYQRAIGPGTALLLKMHRSNFVQLGFVAEVATAELAAIGAAHQVPVLVDQGSGCAADLAPLGLAARRVQDELAAGAGLVCCSGDKLLGGPQAGIILGRRELVQRCKKHPLARALRVDKLTLAALRGTLQDWLLGDPLQTVPGLAALARPVAGVQARAEALARAIGGEAAAIAASCAPGSGALPTQGVPSWCVALRGAKPDRLARRLREGDPPVVPRVQDGEVLLDLRTILPGQDAAVAAAVRAARA